LRGFRCGFCVAQLSFLFKKHVMVYQTIPLILQFSSIGAYVASAVLLAMPDTHDTAVSINTACMFLLPHYTVIGASTFMQQQYIEDKMLGHERSYWENEQVQQALLAYLIMITVYFVALIALDRLKSCSRPSQDTGTAPADTDQVDEDVQAEEARANDQSASYSIRARNLRKVYDVADKDKSKGKKKLVAVNDLSLAVSEGECLGRKSSIEISPPRECGPGSYSSVLSSVYTSKAFRTVYANLQVSARACLLSQHACKQSLGRTAPGKPRPFVCSPQRSPSVAAKHLSTATT
jgi:hypothetical protein